MSFQNPENPDDNLIPADIYFLIRDAAYWIVCPDYQTAGFAVLCQDESLRFCDVPPPTSNSIRPDIRHQILRAKRLGLPGLVVAHGNRSPYNGADRGDIALMFRKDYGGEYLINLVRLGGLPVETPPSECVDPIIYIFLPHALRLKLTVSD
jgi:hypothetical protein